MSSNHPSFMARLQDAIARNQSLLCVGLDPEVCKLPGRLKALAPAEAVVAFNREIIGATVDLVACYKLNLAFYEALGPAGMEALQLTLAFIPNEVPTIGDAKRGDIPNTMRLYARALFDVYGFDAVTASPYLGHDALEPLLMREERGVFILCRTSNPGAAEIMHLQVGCRPLFVEMAERVQAWNENGNVGLVVGATSPQDLRQVREVCPELPLLVPGVGAQQGSLESAVRAGVDKAGAGLLIAAARQVLFASDGDHYPAAARQQALALRDQINRVR